MTRGRFLRMLGMLGLGVGAAPLVPRLRAADPAPAAAPPDATALVSSAIVVDGLVAPGRKSDKSWIAAPGESKRLSGIDAGCWEVGEIDNLENVNVLVEAHGQAAMRIDRTDDVGIARATGRLGLLYYAARHWRLGGSLEPLERWHAHGLRALQVAGEGATELGGTFDDDSTPLNAFGKKVVAALNARGILIDVSLAGARTTLDVAGASSRPIACLHANARRLAQHERNKTDEEIRAVARTGGLVAVANVARGLRGEASGPATAEQFVAHVRHVADLTGIDHVGVATDGSIDGWPRYVYDQTDLVGYDRWYVLAAALRGAGYTDEDIRKVLGLNFVRVLRASIG